MSDNRSTTMTTAEPTTVLPLSERPAPRRRRSFPTVAALAATVVAGGLFALAADDTAAVRFERPHVVPTTVTARGGETATTLAPAVADTRAATTVATATTSPPAPSTTVPERLTGTSRLSLDGVGPVRIGMTLQEASAAAGVPIRLLDMPPGPECRYAVPDRASGTGDELAFMVVEGRIVRIDVGSMGPDTIRTVSGMGKGNTEAEVRATYPGRIRVEPHPYTPEGRHLVYVPTDPGLRHLSMIFATVNGEVRSFRAGFAEQVSWPEGCS